MTQLRLLVVLAACEGFWGLQMLQPVGRAAFLVLLGPNQRIDEGPLSKACKAFYKLIFQNTDGDVAFKAMNDAVSATKQSFSRVNAEMAFKMAYRDFLADQCSGEQKARRVEAMAAQRIAQFRAERGYEMSAHEVAHERDLARQHVESRDEQFKHFRRQYFFIDLFPENDKRFPITLEDCED